MSRCLHGKDICDLLDICVWSAYNTVERLLNYKTMGDREMCAYAADIDRCDCTTIHEEVVSKVRERMPDEDSLLDLSELFKVFGDSTRVKILSALLQAEMCVCDIAVLLGMTKSSISHQLRILKSSKLVKHRKGRKGRLLFAGRRACGKHLRSGPCSCLREVTRVIGLFKRFFKYING